MSLRIDQLGLSVRFVVVEREDDAVTAISFRVYCKGKPYLKLRYDAARDELDYSLVRMSEALRCDERSAVREAKARLLQAMGLDERTDLDNLMMRLVRKEVKSAMIQERLDSYGWFVEEGQIIAVEKSNVGEVLKKFPHCIYINALAREEATKLLAKHLRIA